jgi:hypothetical protein
LAVEVVALRASVGAVPPTGETPPSGDVPAAATVSTTATLPTTVPEFTLHRDSSDESRDVSLMAAAALTPVPGGSGRSRSGA